MCTLLELECFNYFFSCYYICYSYILCSCCTLVAFCWTGKLILFIRSVPSFTAQVLLVDHVCIAELCIACLASYLCRFVVL